MSSQEFKRKSASSTLKVGKWRMPGCESERGHTIRKHFIFLMVICAGMLAGCSASVKAPVDVENVQVSGSGADLETWMLSSNSVTTPDGDRAGASELRRGTDKLKLRFAACCLSPQNAYTAWWLIGDVDKSILAVRAYYGTGFVAESQEIRLDLELEAGERSFENPYEGIRLVVLDHGPSTGNPFQLTTPGGGCESIPCPIVLSAAHPAP